MANNVAYVASTYGSGPYNNCTYSTSNCTSTGTTGGNNGGGTTGATLSNTGFDILVIASLACLLALIAIAVRVWKRPKRADKPSAKS